MKVMEQQTIEVRNLTIEDYQQLKESMIQAYASMGGQFWQEKSLERLIHKFPEGQFCIAINEKVVGCALSIIVDYNKFNDNHTYKQITG
ncbi:MAG: carbon-nitrogen hydrolase, partial [Parafilimonas sp.]